MPCPTVNVLREDFCCLGSPSEYQLKSADFYKCVLSFTEKVRVLARSQEILGARTSKINSNYDLINDFGYLYTLLSMAYLEQLMNLKDYPCVPLSYDYFNTTYNLDCVIAWFKCKGFDVKDLIDIFIPQESNIGINYMAIEEVIAGCTTPSIFKIK
jgi:hypothetical protein